jgi:tetratricopeptide (TPR) repeat protein
MTYDDMGQHAEAIGWLEKCIELSDPSGSHLRKAYAILVNCLMKVNRLDDAVAVCQRGRGLFPKDPELCFREGLLMHRQGQLPEAARAYAAVLAMETEPHFKSVDPGILGYKSRQNLALVLREMGQHSVVEFHCRCILEEKPAYLPAARLLGDSLIAQGKFQTALVEAERMQSRPQSRAIGVLLGAEVAFRRGDREFAEAAMQSAAEEFPEDLDVANAAARLLFEFGDLNRAELALTRVIDLCPTDGAAYHNLGLISLRKGETQNAIGAFQKSLALRPESAGTKDLLDQSFVQAE